MRVKFIAFCGMNYTLESDLSLSDARVLAANVLRDRRADGFSVSTLEHGSEWECVEPEDSLLVPDTAGYLVLQSESGDSEPEETE